VILRRPLRALTVDVYHCDVTSFAGNATAGCVPDPGSTSGDDCDFATQLT
jgi:hypothetical protein